MTPYFERDGVTIYHGDCRDVLPTIEAASVDLVVTSPPYNLSDRGFFAIAKNGNLDPKASKWTRSGLIGGYGEHDDAMPWEAYRDWQRDTLRECWRLISDDGAIFYNHKPRMVNGIARLPLDYNPGLPLRQVIIWDRVEPGMNVNISHFAPRCEWLMLMARPSFRLVDIKASSVGDVWSIQRDRSMEHPAPFPIGLPVRAISSTKAEVVLDPFMGSGATLRAAADLGRRAIGIEIEERYCEIAAKRLSQMVLPMGEAS